MSLEIDSTQSLNPPGYVSYVTVYHETVGIY